MAMGLPYDSDAGRAWAGTVTALMTGHAYASSARIAARVGPFPGYALDSAAMLRVLEQHREAVIEIEEELVPTELLGAAQRAWDTACESAGEHGVRNSQVSVIAPTGTIGLLMDCDTTGVEPDLGLIKYKKLVGGGTMTIVNRTIPRALRRLGYSPEQIEDIVAHIEQHNSVLDAPHLAPGHRGVFACAMGDQPIHHTGHVRMMAAIQPFVSGSISKTINMPETATVEDIEELLVEAWELGVKAVAIYRDGSKVGQPLSDKAEATDAERHDADVSEQVAALVQEHLAHHGAPVREKLPRSRVSRTLEFRVADCKGFVTVGEYENGQPGEIFVRVSKQGSTLAGIMDAFAVAISYGLQYGVPLAAFVDAFVGMRFEPAGITDDPDVRIASSLMDYLFRRLAIEYLDADERQALGIQTMEERSQPTLPGLELVAESTDPNLAAPSDPKSPGPTAIGVDGSPTAPGPGLVMSDRGEVCMNCGSARMMRSGSCLVCGDCGTTTGCS
jgi:ribonucleoside-diphosphate reductase alpha chain